MVQALLDEKTDDAIRVEQEVASRRLLVTNDGVQRLKLCGVRQCEH